MVNSTATPMKELLNWLRNSDIMTTTERGVTTATYETAGELDYIVIDKTNVKNIRSITKNGTPLKYGKDYTFNTNYNAGVIICWIDFTSTQTGAFIVTYDYGSDRIFTDYPRDDLKINSYPRITADIISETSDAYGLGGDTFIENTLFTIIIYGKNQDYVREHIETLKQKVKQSAKDFYFYPFVKPVNRNPIIKSENRSDTILVGSLDISGMFNIDSV